MDHIKEAFQKVKEDIQELKKELNSFKISLEDILKEMVRLCEIVEQFSGKLKENSRQEVLKEPSSAPTLKPKIPTSPLDIPTHNFSLKPLKPQNLLISTGNEGVPTNRQTDKQTNKYITLEPKVEKKEENPIKNASEIFDSLDNLKKEIRLKFKRLTEQEILVFSTIYQLEEEQGQVEYKTISNKLNLSQSSIRDYVGRLILKGIPVEKKRINNKTILLSISQDLKKIASLSAILKLRDI